MAWRGWARRARERFHEMSPPAGGSSAAPMDAVMAARPPFVEPVDEWRRVPLHGDEYAHPNNEVEHLVVGKTGAVLQAYPDTTQVADLFVEKTSGNER